MLFSDHLAAEPPYIAGMSEVSDSLRLVGTFPRGGRPIFTLAFFGLEWAFEPLALSRWPLAFSSVGFLVGVFSFAVKLVGVVLG